MIMRPRIPSFGRRCKYRTWQRRWDFPMQFRDRECFSLSFILLLARSAIRVAVQLNWANFCAFRALQQGAKFEHETIAYEHVTRVYISKEALTSTQLIFL